MVIDAFAADKPVGAICHGVLVAARAVDPRTERSVLYGRADDGPDVVAGGQGLGHRPLDALLGRQLLPHVHGGARPTCRLHVGPARGDAGPGRTLRLQGRDQGHAGLAAQVERTGTRHTDGFRVRPSSFVTAPTSRRVGPGTCSRSPGRSPKSWLSAGRRSDGPAGPTGRGPGSAARRHHFGSEHHRARHLDAVTPRLLGHVERLVGRLDDVEGRGGGTRCPRGHAATHRRHRRVRRPGLVPDARGRAPPGGRAHWRRTTSSPGRSPAPGARTPPRRSGRQASLARMTSSILEAIRRRASSPAMCP